MWISTFATYHTPTNSHRHATPSVTLKNKSNRKKVNFKAFHADWSISIVRLIKRFQLINQIDTILTGLKPSNEKTVAKQILNDSATHSVEHLDYHIRMQRFEYCEIARAHNIDWSWNSFWRSRCCFFVILTANPQCTPSSYFFCLSLILDCWPLFLFHFMLILLWLLLVCV